MSVLMFILYISSFLKFRLGMELFLGSVTFKNENSKTAQNQLLLFIQSWKLVNQKCRSSFKQYSTLFKLKRLVCLV